MSCSGTRSSSSSSSNSSSSGGGSGSGSSGSGRSRSRIGVILAVRVVIIFCDTKRSSGLFPADPGSILLTLCLWVIDWWRKEVRRQAKTAPVFQSSPTLFMGTFRYLSGCTSDSCEGHWISWSQKVEVLTTKSQMLSLPADSWMINHYWFPAVLWMSLHAGSGVERVSPICFLAASPLVHPGFLLNVLCSSLGKRWLCSVIALFCVLFFVFCLLVVLVWLSVPVQDWSPE